MIFNSQEFLIFFVVVISVFFALPSKYRRIFLLICSYFFYGWWNWAYLFLILASTITDFAVAKKIYKTDNRKNRRNWLILSVFVNIGILFTFKYANFFAQLLNITTSENPLLDVVLPVGISFYTFQTLSYTIDVYRRKMKPEQNLVRFSLYVAFFPQLVAGPIERASKILPQLDFTADFDSERFVKGGILMLWGFFQKVVVADNLSVFVDEVYSNPQSYSGINIAIVSVFFAFQIYCDFAGYTNIARGIAKMMNVELSLNFKQPYFATSIKDFWRRWHITLSQWFRDYVYFSLGGSKQSKIKWLMAIFVTFTASGLWHGANITFIVWGALFAVFYIIEKYFYEIFLKENQEKKGILKFFRIIITFVTVTFLWIFFRSNSLDTAFVLIKKLFLHNFHIVFDRKWLLVNIILIFSVLLVDIKETKEQIQDWFIRQKSFIQATFVSFLFFMILTIGNWHLTPFIYFQF